MSNVISGKSLDDQLIDLRNRLTAEYGDRADARTVRRSIQDSLAALGTPTVTTYVPVLVERAARLRLRALTDASS